MRVCAGCQCAVQRSYLEGALPILQLLQVRVGMLFGRLRSSIASGMCVFNLSVFVLLMCVNSKAG